MARLQLHYVGVDMAVAFRHHHLAPGFSLIVGDPKGGGIAGETVRGIGADPVGEDPAAVGKHLDRLAAEGSLLRENRFIGAPGHAAVGAFLAADHGGELHVVFARLPVQLSRVHGPYGVVRTVKKRRVLLAAGRIAGNLHRRKPCGCALGKAGADDVDVGAAFIGACEPAAQQIAVGKLRHGGSVGGGIAACRKQRFQSSHFFVFVDGSVPGQTGKLWIRHGFPSISIICFERPVNRPSVPNPPDLVITWRVQPW